MPLVRGRGADQQGDVHPVERRRGVVGDVDPGEQRERAVVELHRRALGAFTACGISSRRSRTGVSGPSSWPEAMRKSSA
jgi:hypothetical protein